ncbi:MAG: DUF2934 domain-containing protein [Candidatus Sulfotelmatobacter sp.]
MARSRSIPTSKASPTNSNKEQPSASNPAKLPDVKPIAEGITLAEVAAEARIKPEPRKLEVVKTEPRKNVVAPVNLEDEIRRRAYELYLQRGSASGSEAEDWLSAEAEVRQRYRKQSA